jgi:hypothetical protein
MAPSERPPFSNSFRTSAFRLAIAYCLLFTVSVSALLGAIYLITGSVLANEVDNVILIELDALADEYDREGQDGRNCGAGATARKLGTRGGDLSTR